MKNKDIIDAIRTIAKNESLTPLMCTVIDGSYNATNKTVDVRPLNGDADLLDILINANKSDGFLLVPKDGTLVAVTLTSLTTGFVSMVSEVDLVLLNGDVNGGLVKVIDLTAKLNNCEDKINLILTFLATLGATPPLTTPLIPTVRSNIENTNVKHGE